MKKFLLITCVSLFIILFLYKLKLVNDNSQMVFLTDIQEIDTSSYSSSNYYTITTNQEHILEYTEDDIGLDTNESVNSQNNISLININTASKELLTTLPNIGEKIAQNIIDYRQENGDFQNIEEIKNVNRIGDKIYEKIKDYITVGG